MTDFSVRLCAITAQESGLDAEDIAQSPGLMSTGLLDSFALVSVISFVENHVGGEIPAADLTFANFELVQAICSCVERFHAS